MSTFHLRRTVSCLSLFFFAFFISLSSFAYPQRGYPYPPYQLGTMEWVSQIGTSLQGEYYATTRHDGSAVVPSSLFTFIGISGPDASAFEVATTETEWNFQYWAGSGDEWRFPVIFHPTHSGTYHAVLNFLDTAGVEWLYDPVPFTIELSGKTEEKTIEVKSAKMRKIEAKSFLEVQTVRNFGQFRYSYLTFYFPWEGQRHDVDLTTTINGQQIHMTKQSMDSLRKEDIDVDPFLIDLDHENVPRFTKNMKFNLTAAVNINGRKEDTKPAVVLLPIVMILGTGDDLQPRNMGFGAEFIGPKSARVLESANILGEGYNHNARYNTLFILSYSATTAIQSDIYAGVPAFRTLMNTIREVTYADKVDVIGYSFGGITARALVEAKVETNADENVIHSVFTLASPHTGTPYAYFTFSTGRPNNVLRTLHKMFGDIENARNMLPLWPAWRTSEYDRYRYSPSLPGGISLDRLASSNPQLARLSGMLESGIRFPVSIPLYLYYSDSYTFPFEEGYSGSLYTVTTNFGTKIIETPIFGFIPGDNFITANSQLGFITNPNNPNMLPEIIPAFRNGYLLETIQTRRMEGETHRSFLSEAVANRIVLDLLYDVLPRP